MESSYSRKYYETDVKCPRTTLLVRCTGPAYIFIIIISSQSTKCYIHIVANTCRYYEASMRPLVLALHVRRYLFDA